MAVANRLWNESKEVLHLGHSNKNAQHDATTNGRSKGHEKQAQNSQPSRDSAKSDTVKHGPQGGFDSTPIPSPPSGTIGYTLKFTFHQAHGLTMGDVHVLSSDPYVLAQLNTGLPRRHKEDPNLRFRTETVRKDTNPEWDDEWIVANVPSTGFTLKARVYDEDPADHDDLLGKIHLTVPHIDDHWAGFKNQPQKLTLRGSSARAVVIRSLARGFRFVHNVHGELFVSIENLGRTVEDGQNGRVYTVGPCRWTRHYSPILGRIANLKEPDQDEEDPGATSNCPVQKRVDRYNFQANQIQFEGPVPPELYHRFVEFKPWVRRMFTTKGIQGVLLGKALHHQHMRVYNFGRDTLWGHIPSGNSTEMTKQFLELVHYDMGGRIFTYVLTLDALFRFTETGKEFGIDMLSKHTMHSDVSIYIAFSGEFFIRRLKHSHRPPPPHPTEGTSQHDGPDKENQGNEAHPPHDLDDGPPEVDPPKDPNFYELVIDNDSGTYRPNAAMLPVLAKFLSHCLPGLHIQTLDCQADEKKMAKLKHEQRERKKREGDHIVYAQVSDSSSLSSSDDERLDEIQSEYQGDGQPERGQSAGKRVSKTRKAISTAAKDVKLEHGARMEKMTSNMKGRDDDGEIVEFKGPKALAEGEG